MAKYAIGLDYGTNSVRTIIVDVRSGREIATAVWNYAHGDHGIILSRDCNMARQHPADYITGAEKTIVAALKIARKSLRGFDSGDIIGIGVDTTGSTPLPVDAAGQPLAFDRRFSRTPAALAWLWKDHTSTAEAAEITEQARRIRPHYLARCGGVYSSEWFFSKILHCLRTAPEVFKAAFSWVEIADWIPAMLTATESPRTLTAGICAAGHKAMYNAEWGGYPDKDFLAGLDPKLADLRDRLSANVVDVSHSVGGLSAAWARKTGLTEGIPVAAGAFDCHLGAIGAGIVPGTLVKIIGTSTCDVTVMPADQGVADIPGLCGIVHGSVLPAMFGLEAGQSAVGDIFNWFVNTVVPGNRKSSHSHEDLSAVAAMLKPGESGLLALDWNNGNRTILVDQRLTGLLIGQTLYTTPSEIYRALIEATAFGALTIINRFEEYGVKIKQVINCGGIAEKNPLVMQIYADVTGRPMYVSRSAQTCALGAAVAGAVVAGSARGGYDDFTQAQRNMTGLKKKVYQPRRSAHEVYQQLYPLYRQVHDCFGTNTWKGDCSNVMKRLIEIRDQTRR